jgi:O-antigen/teichoic acid export membrane protein
VRDPGHVDAGLGDRAAAPDMTSSSADRPWDGLARAAAATWALRLSIYAVSIGTSILIARALGPEGRGEYYFPILVTGTLFTALHLGAEHAHVFLFGRGRGLAELASNAGVLAAAAGLAGIGLGLTAWAWLHDSLMAGLQLGVLALALLSLPPSLHTLYLAGLLVLRGDVVHLQRVNLGGAVVQALLVAGLVVTERVSVAAVVAVNSVAVAVTWALTARRFASATPLRIGWDPRLGRETLRFGLLMQVNILFTFLNLRVDSYLVKYFLGLRELGYYSLAVSLAELVWLATDSVAMVILPHQTRADSRDVAVLTTRTCRISFLVAMLLAAGLAAGAYPLVALAYGPAFLPALPALWLLLPGIVAASLWRPLAGYLIKLGRPLVMGAISGAAVVVNVLLNWWLIPVWGTAGAAVATSASYAALAAGCLVWFLRRSGVPAGELLRIRAESISMWNLVQRDLLRMAKR